ncbi:MAG: DUF2723 domain-containing protein [Myxococcota bacterium]
MSRRAERPQSDRANVARVLGLRVGDRRATLAAAVLLTLYYVWSMHRSISMYDSPELAMVAEQLGLGHPIGQPLYMLLGYLASVLSPDPLIGLNALSAVLGAWTLVPAASLAETWGQRRETRGAVWAQLGAIGGCALLPCVWEPSTRIETYPLATFLALWSVARLSELSEREDSRWSAYGVSGLVLGLSASANPYCALGAALAIAPIVAVRLFRAPMQLRHAVALVISGVLGLLPYLYVPWAARRPEVVAWGRPIETDALIRYFTGADYGRARELTESMFADNLGEFVAWGWSFGMIPLWALGLLGFVAYRKRAASTLAVTLPAIAMLLFASLVASNAVFSPDVLDYLGYLAVPSWIAISGVAVLVGCVSKERPYVPVAAALAVVVLLGTSSPEPWVRTRRFDSVTFELAARALESAPKNSVVLVEADHWVAPMWYLQEQRGLRPDVVVVAYGLASSSWFWDLLWHRHPELTPIELLGGDRASRLKRFLSANPGREVLFEDYALGRRVGRNSCPTGWLWRSAPSCESAVEPAMERFIEGARVQLGDGSPGTAGLLAGLAYDRGVGLLGIGRPRDAMRALLASAPAPETRSLALTEVPERNEGITRVVLPERRLVALGDPDYNVALAAEIASAYDAPGLASRIIESSH